jgi:hypothetical protein
VVVEQFDVVLGVAAVLKGFLEVDGEVAGDTEEPGDEGDAAGLVASDGLQGVQKGLGGEVLGERGVAREKEGVAEDSALVTFVKMAEGFAIASGGERY